MTLTNDDLKKLKTEFKDDAIGVKLQSTSKDKTKGMLILYLQHTDVYDRLEEVDPSWSFETVSIETSNREGWGGKVETVTSVRAKLTLKGVSRENVGEGDDPKSAYSDALKRCAMLFGVGRYLYDAEQVWVPYNEQTDRFKKWTIQDYRKFSRLRSDSSGSPKSGPLPATTQSNAPLASPQSGKTGIKTESKQMQAKYSRDTHSRDGSPLPSASGGTDDFFAWDDAKL